MLARAAVLLAFAIVLGIPFALRPAAVRDDRTDAEQLIIVTPHVQQIRAEFSRAFDAWHHARTGRHVAIDWRSPGGTSEIVKQLEAQYQAALAGGHFRLEDGQVIMEPGAIGFDLMLGGGSYDHGRLKRGVAWTIDGTPINVPMSVPAGFTQDQLDDWYGENRIGAQHLYDPDQHWLGTALSGFGIVYNRDVLRRLGLPEPRSFEDLTDPRYAGWVAIADPRQSGSVTTTFDSILSNYGWEKGWRILREMAANARYFSNSSAKIPIDVSQGEAAAGLAIDFYGRGQAQSVLRPGERPEEGRVGYVDPVGTVYIDADPASLLRGAPHPELAKAFVEFTLSEEGQALWQFPAVLTNPLGEENPIGEEGRRLGPERFELRRMPVRREMYRKHLVRFIDKVDPFTLASDTTSKGWRGAIGPMMGAFAIDVPEEQQAAWIALNRARTDTAFPRDVLEEMESLFYAWPEHTVLKDDGTVEAMLPFTPENYRAITADWRRPGVAAKSRIAYTAFFRDNYARIVRLANEPALASADK